MSAAVKGLVLLLFLGVGGIILFFFHMMRILDKWETEPPEGRE